jgi:hypothetical protein
MAAASATAPAIFAVAASEIASAPPLRVGPLTVALADDLAAVRLEPVAGLRVEERAEDFGGFLEGIWKPVIESQATLQCLCPRLFTAAHRLHFGT